MDLRLAHSGRVETGSEEEQAYGEVTKLLHQVAWGMNKKSTGISFCGGSILLHEKVEVARKLRDIIRKRALAVITGDTGIPDHADIAVVFEQEPHSSTLHEVSDEKRGAGVYQLSVFRKLCPEYSGEMCLFSSAQILAKMPVTLVDEIRPTVVAEQPPAPLAQVLTLTVKRKPPPAEGK